MNIPQNCRPRRFMSCGEPQNYCQKAGRWRRELALYNDDAYRKLFLLFHHRHHHAAITSLHQSGVTLSDLQSKISNLPASLFGRFLEADLF